MRAGTNANRGRGRRLVRGPKAGRASTPDPGVQAPEGWSVGGGREGDRLEALGITSPERLGRMDPGALAFWLGVHRRDADRWVARAQVLAAGSPKADVGMGPADATDPLPGLLAAASRTPSATGAKAIDPAAEAPAADALLESWIRLVEEMQHSVHAPAPKKRAD